MNAALRALTVASCLALTLSACATLEVTVGILDKQKLPLEKKVESNAWLEATRYSKEAELAYYATLQRLGVEEVSGIIDELLKPLTPAEIAAGGIPVATSAQELANIKSGIQKKASADLKQAREAGEEGLRLYHRARLIEGQERATTMTQALEQLRQNRQLGEKFVDTLKADLDAYITQFANRNVPQRVTDARENAQKAVDDIRAVTKARSTLFGGAALFEDPLASWVVSSPKETWNAHFNRSYGAGFLGNVDIAVKLEREATFTLKGVRLDAAKTTAATFAVMRQAVNVFAGGVPLPSTSTKTAPTTAPVPEASSTPSTPDASRSLLDAAEAIRESERLQREQAQFALSAIFESIVRNRKQLEESTAATRQAALSEVLIVYNAHKAMLANPKEGEGQ